MEGDFRVLPTLAAFADLGDSTIIIRLFICWFNSRGEWFAKTYLIILFIFLFTSRGYKCFPVNDLPIPI